jgi:hypothetical protein
MPSPFPGMDPYLEEPSLWPDVHTSLLVEVRTALNAILPERYGAFIDCYVWLHEPDAYIVACEPTAGEATVAIPAPAVVTLPAMQRQGQRYLRIIDRRNRRVVTVLELLSPSNKEAGLDRENYLTKRNEYLAAGTNLVEIDLLRWGQRLPLGEPNPAPADYYVLVSRAAEFPRAGIWPFSVRDPLPPILVPLNPEDQPVTLDLKACLDLVYDKARYDLELDYSVPPVPPLREPDAAWARQLLAPRSAGTHQGEQP